MTARDTLRATLTPRYCRELRAVYQVARKLPRPGHALDSPTALADFLRPLYDDLAHEQVGVLGLDSKHYPIAHRLIGRGSVDASLCSPRDVYQAALLMNAARVAVCHNHPSGDTTPSREDRTLCKQLAQAGEMLALPMVDFLIIGAHGGFWSAHQAGLV